MAGFNGFGGGGLAEMASGMAGLMGSVQDYSTDHTSDTRLPTCGIEIVGTTKKCSDLKGFEDSLVVLEYDYGLRGSVNSNVSGEMRASGVVAGSNVRVLLLSSGYDIEIMGLMARKTLIDTIKIKTFAVNNEEFEKGVKEVALDEFCGCSIVSVYNQSSDKLLMEFRWQQFLPSRKIVSSDGKVAGNMAGAIDMGTGEIGKTKKS